MNAHIRIVVAGLVVIASLAGPSVTAVEQDVAIRYRWNKGETLRYRSTNQSTAVMSGLPGGMGDMNVEQETVQVLRTVVQDVAADGTTTLEQLFESMRMDIGSPMGKITYDSASPDTSVKPNPMSMLSAMLGEPFTVIVSPTGAVKKVEGFSRIIEKMFKNVPQDPAGAAVLNALKGTFNDETLVDMMSQGFTQLPDRPLKLGDSWNNHLTMSNPMIGGLTMSVIATLKSVEGSGADQVARIATQLTIKENAAASPTVNPLGMRRQLGESTGEGETLFDVAKGRMLRSTTRMTLSMKMSGDLPDGTAMSLKADTKSTITVELMEK